MAVPDPSPNVTATLKKSLKELLARPAYPTEGVDAALLREYVAKQYGTAITSQKASGFLKSQKNLDGVKKGGRIVYFKKNGQKDHPELKGGRKGTSQINIKPSDETNPPASTPPSPRENVSRHVLNMVGDMLSWRAAIQRAKLEKRASKLPNCTLGFTQEFLIGLGKVEHSALVAKHAALRAAMVELRLLSPDQTVKKLQELIGYAAIETLWEVCQEKEDPKVEARRLVRMPFHKLRNEWARRIDDMIKQLEERGVTLPPPRPLVPPRPAVTIPPRAVPPAAEPEDAPAVDQPTKGPEVDATDDPQAQPEAAVQEVARLKEQLADVNKSRNYYQTRATNKENELKELAAQLHRTREERDEARDDKALPVDVRTKLDVVDALCKDRAVEPADVRKFVSKLAKDRGDFATEIAYVMGTKEDPVKGQLTAHVNALTEQIQTLREENERLKKAAKLPAAEEKKRAEKGRTWTQTARMLAVWSKTAARRAIIALLFAVVVIVVALSLSGRLGQLIEPPVAPEAEPAAEEEVVEEEAETEEPAAESEDEEELLFEPYRYEP